MIRNLTIATGVVVFLANVLFGQSILPPGKQTIADQYAEQRAAGAQNPAPKNPSASYPVPPEPPFQVGIQGGCSNPLSSQAYDIISCWQGLQNGVRTFVYSGAEGENFDGQQGVIIVVTQPDYPTLGSIQTIPTPLRVGQVEIVASQNSILLLQSETGSYVFQFNLDTLSFTSHKVAPATLIPAGQLSVTTSGLAYSRVNQTFTGAMTISNIGSVAINAPLNIVLTSLSSGVTVLTSTGAFNGVPYTTVPAVPTLAPGQSVTMNVQFANPSNGLINFTPVGYSGSFNN